MAITSPEASVWIMALRAAGLAIMVGPSFCDGGMASPCCINVGGSLRIGSRSRPLPDRTLM